MSHKKTDLSTTRVAIYVRVSTVYQVDKDSLPTQRNELTSYAQYVLNADSWEIFEDAGFSGKNTDRPAFQEMMTRVRQGEFTHILVFKLDRISRNLLDFAAMYDELKKLGVTFVSKNEQFDTSSAMGEAMLKIILVFAELERKITGERVTSVMLSRAESGQWNGGKVPYGYNYDKLTTTFSINEEEAVVVRKIFDLYEKYRSMIKVVRTLNESGYRHRSGKEWCPTSVSIILSSIFYTGTYRYNYHEPGQRQNLKPESEWILVENHHPAIIEKEQYNRVKIIREANKRGVFGNGKTYERKNVHIFAGLLTCGDCGCVMSATSNCRVMKDGYRPSIYACLGHRSHGVCKNKYTTDLKLGPFVLSYLANIIRTKSSFGKSTSLEMFQKKLLKGDALNNVVAIKEAGLTELYNLYRSEIDGVPYALKPSNSEVDTSEKDTLISEKRRLERALTRLKSLYLYSEEDMSQKDYIVEKNSLEASLGKVNDRLLQLDIIASEKFDISDEELIEKASYFLMSQKLLDKRFVDYRKLLRETDNRVLKEFINSVCSKFVVRDGRILSITFKNGITHEFVYENDEKENSEQEE